MSKDSKNVTNIFLRCFVLELWMYKFDKTKKNRRFPEKREPVCKSTFTRFHFTEIPDVRAKWMVPRYLRGKVPKWGILECRHFDHRINICAWDFQDKNLDHILKFLSRRQLPYKNLGAIFLVMWQGCIVWKACNFPRFGVQ